MPPLLTRWISAINSGDLIRLVEIMSPSHTFFVEGEHPTIGKEKNHRAWQGYFSTFPNYQIFIDEYFDRPDAWYLVGHTQGSHVPPEIESIPRSVIWRAVLEGSQVFEWSIYPGDEAHCRQFSLPSR